MGLLLVRSPPDILATMSVLDVVEAACSLAPDKDLWLERLAESVQEATAGSPLLGACYRWPRGGTLAVERLTTRDIDPERLGFIQQALADLMASYPAEVRRLYCGLHVATMSQRGPEIGMSAGETAEMLAFYDRFGIGDMRALCGADPNGTGVLFTSLVERQELSERQRRRWMPVAAHLAAAARLRASANEGQLERRTEAVLEPSGRVVHAEGPGAEREARESLAQACRAMERARTRSGRARPDESLDSWQAMVSGRWTVVERVDTDSRRYLLAVENVPAYERVLALTPRETMIIERVATGRTNKWIAYELGISAGTVGSTLQAAMSKLGVPNRAAVADLVQRARGVDTVVEAESPRLILAAGPRGGDELRLSEAEREIVAFVRAGKSDASIAEARGVALKTVRNQLHALYERVGVSSRAALIAALGD